MHAARLGWAVSKPYVHDENGFSGTQLGIIDFGFLFSYSIGLYVSGWLEDKFPLIKVMVIGLIVTALSLIIVGFLGLDNLDSIVV